MNVQIFHGNTPNQSNKENTIMWTTPIVHEVAVGLEINCYACGEL